MTDQPVNTKEELLAAIDQGWNAFQTYLASLEYEQVMIPTDAAGWSIKDHLTHLAAWEDGIYALLEYHPRAAYMGVPDDLWEQAAAGDWDTVNEVIRRRYQEIGLMDLQQKFFSQHARLIEKIRSLADEYLQRPYNHYQPHSSWDAPVIGWIRGNTYEHYAEHQPWIAAIAADESGIMNKAKLLNEIDRGWSKVSDFVSSLTDAQLTDLIDANGWNIKDHLIHLAVWEDGIYALLQGLQRLDTEYMGIDEKIWERGDNDEINAIIRERYRDLPLTDVLLRRQQVHQRLIEKIQSMTDEDLQRPYRFYENHSTDESPVIAHIIGNTFAHYADQLPWMKAIAAKG